MNVRLSPALEKVVRERVARGVYESADALVEEAVQHLLDEETNEDAHLDQIRARIEAAEAEIDRGDFVEFDENTVHNLAKEVHERGLKRLSSEREKTGTRG